MVVVVVVVMVVPVDDGDMVEGEIMARFYGAGF